MAGVFLSRLAADLAAVLITPFAGVLGTDRFQRPLQPLLFSAGVERGLQFGGDHASSLGCVGHRNAGYARLIGADNPHFDARASPNGQRFSLTELLPVFDFSSSDPAYQAVTVRLSDLPSSLNWAVARPLASSSARMDFPASDTFT